MNNLIALWFSSHSSWSICCFLLFFLVLISSIERFISILACSICFFLLSQFLNFLLLLFWDYLFSHLILLLLPLFFLILAFFRNFCSIRSSFYFKFSIFSLFKDLLLLLQENLLIPYFSPLLTFSLLFFHFTVIFLLKFYWLFMVYVLFIFFQFRLVCVLFLLHRLFQTSLVFSAFQIQIQINSAF